MTDIFSESNLQDEENKSLLLNKLQDNSLSSFQDSFSQQNMQHELKERNYIKKNHLSNKEQQQSDNQQNINSHILEQDNLNINDLENEFKLDLSRINSNSKPKLQLRACRKIDKHIENKKINQKNSYSQFNAETSTDYNIEKEHYQEIDSFQEKESYLKRQNHIEKQCKNEQGNNCIMKNNIIINDMNKRSRSSEKNYQIHTKQPIGKKYPDIFRRREVLKLLNKPNEKQLILQYDKNFNSQIYDKNSISQKQKLIKQDNDYYQSDQTSDMNSSLTIKSMRQSYTSMLKNTAIQEAWKKLSSSQYIEQQNGFHSERLHNNETQLMSKKNNEQNKERIKLRAKQNSSISINQSEVINLQRFSIDSSGTPISATTQQQNTVFGTYRSRFFEKNTIDGKLTSRSGLFEEQKNNIIGSLQIKSQRIENINDDFHKMSYIQKQAYYKQEKFNSRFQGSFKQNSNSNPNDTLYRNSQYDTIKQSKNLFKELISKQRLMQTQYNYISQQQDSNQLSSQENRNIQPAKDYNINKISNKKISSHQLYSNNSETLIESIKRQYLNREVLQSRKEGTQDKDLQDQVVKLDLLKNSSECQQIYKLQEQDESCKNQNKRKLSNDIPAFNQTHNSTYFPEIQAPLKINMLILSQSQKDSLNNKINLNININQEKRNIPFVQKQFSDKNIFEGNSKINKQNDIGTGKTDQRLINKDEHLSQLYTDFQGFAIDNSPNNLNEADDDEDEPELNFFLKSQQISSPNNKTQKEPQRSSSRSVSSQNKDKQFLKKYTLKRNQPNVYSNKSKLDQKF